MAKYKIIDVSEFNGVINWKNVAKSCDGAIIRVGYRGYSAGTLKEDERARINLKEASEAGVPIGVYFFTQAITEAEAREEAKFTINMIKGYKIALPVFIDSEDATDDYRGRADHNKLSRADRTAIIKAFCEEVQKEGYAGGVYAGEWWLNTFLYADKLTNFYLWVAKYSSIEPNINSNTITWDAWQYASTAIIDGVAGYCDVSEFYNISISKPKAKKKKSYEKVAEEVIAGKWGNGTKRKKALEAAGYDYYKVQDLVNAKLKANTEDKKKYYTIKAGDTLSSIANKYSTTVDKLVKLNNIENANKIYAGDKIRVK